jgi:hypothetical protein
VPGQLCSAGFSLTKGLHFLDIALDYFGQAAYFGEHNPARMETIMNTPFSNASQKSSARELVIALDELLRHFSPADTSAKEGILGKLCRIAIRDGKLLLRYHELLCFLRAYPDNPKILQLSESELQNFGNRVALCLKSDESAASMLLNTGISGSVVEYPYDWDMALWLAKKFPGAITIDWEAYNDAETDNLSSVLPLLVSWPENDTLDDPEMATEDWVAAAKGEGQTDFEWLLTRFGESSLPPDIQRHLYEQVELPLHWKLENSEMTRSRARLPKQEIRYQQGPIARPEGDLRSETVKPLPPMRVLSKPKAEAIVDLTLSALLVRQRELYPVDHANPDEVYLADVGRGIQIAIIGTKPAFRLPLEADYAAFIIKNGLPIGYGVGAVLFDRVELAINVFDTFRGGEAAYIFAQYLRVFHHHFGVTNFILRRYQVGYENEEGLAAGAYWFYYKQGFRSFDEKVARLADEEFAKIQADRSYRSSRRTLKRLALSDMYMSLNEKTKPYKELSLSKLGLAVTHNIAKEHHGNKDAAIRAGTRRLARVLGLPVWAKWPPDEQESFRRLSLLFHLIPDLEKWPKGEKTLLAQIMRAKGKPGETEFARGLLKHKRLYEALRKIAEREES